MKTHSKLLLYMASLLLLITTLCAAASTNLLDCDDTLVGLASCLDYVTDASDYPTDECCEQFTGICQAENPCCCAYIDGSANEFLGEPIDPERAENLPYACDYVPGASQARSTSKGATVANTKAINGTAWKRTWKEKQAKSPNP
ncbi:Bifunctional inhibitor/lipid-transfer protein/seed storage 2S albumin superfamily protein [Rhynchospora pubera]|uniref:Bifunctional inhibitor/lipid-transfer protein/seed storage 2S albumin superfamily protein n=1 Tax=Rhynchospora pubera TaxID=906938 RepID=A0AAV8H863_9POAL|nr:Bifunctional inhibitor/lipid-transfer protein/seed storage 2S albumin superfamily protein [Rhynchospora pubera]